MNKVELMGRLGGDPAPQQTKSGVSCCAFSVAVPREYKAADGTYPTDWIRCVAWRGTADFISKYFHRGDGIALVGTINTNTYEKNGEKRTSFEVIVQQAYFPPSNNRSGNKQSEPESDGYYPDPPSVPEAADYSPAGSDDYPF